MLRAVDFDIGPEDGVVSVGDLYREQGWLDPTAAQALRAEQVRQIADVDRQWCANIEAAGVELEPAVAATISQLRTERDALLSVAEAAKAWAHTTFGNDLKPIDGDEDHYSLAELTLLAAVDEWQKAVTDG
jgi:hypothetical protein